MDKILSYPGESVGDGAAAGSMDKVGGYSGAEIWQTESHGINFFAQAMSDLMPSPADVHI